MKSSAGYLANGVEALVAAHYRKLVSEKTSDALQRIKAQGRRWGNDPPYGTTWQDGRAVPNPAEMKVLAQVARMHKAGLKLRGISAKLAAAGVLNRQGRVFHPATIARMLQQRSK